MIDKQHLTQADRPYIQSVVGRYGRTYYFKHDEYVGRSVFKMGEFSPEECAYIVKLASERPGELVLDIGANIGCISQALIAVGFEVEAFEPQPAVFELLERNVASTLQEPPSIKCHNIALGSRSGTAQMPLVDYSKRNNFGGLGIGQGHGLRVELRTLDSFNYSNVGLIKLDVEGYEEEVLRGAVETIARCKPIIYLEADRGEKLTALATFLSSLGYAYVTHNPPLFSPENYFGEPVRPWDRNFVSMNWVCRPI